MATEACLRCRVSGRVQGVWFRDSTRRKAESLGIHGSAVNLPDGSVEVIACGTPDALSALRAWLQQGPELAQVDAVHCAAHAEPVAAGFQIG